MVAVIAGGTSNNSRAAAPEAQVARVPLIAPSSTDPQVTQVGDYIFRTCFIDAFQGEVMARFAANTLKAKKAGILLDFNSSYSRGLSDFFELSFTRLGGQVVSKQSYTAGDRDYRGQLNTLRAAAPDVIFIPGYYEDVALMAKQARQLGITQPLLGADGWDAPELWERGGDSLNGSYISSHYSAEDQSPRGAEVCERLQADTTAIYNRTPTLRLATTPCAWWPKPFNAPAQLMVQSCATLWRRRRVFPV